MANQYKNKVIYNGQTLIDLTGVTVTPDVLSQGYTAIDASGAPITGTASSGGIIIRDTTDSHGGTIREITATDVVNLQGGKTVTPSTSSQTVTPDTGYDAFESVTVSAMPSGTAGTPTATKGTVSNHSVSVTPSVTNTTGYITGDTKIGTAVTVSASELVSGSQTITDNDTYDVTNLASVTVNVSGSSTTVTPLSVTQNGTYTAPTGTAYSPVTVNVPTGGGASNFVTGTFTTGSTTNTVGEVTVPYTGSGYPIMLVTVVEGGFNESAWKTTLLRYAVGMHTIYKFRPGSTPTYDATGTENQGTVTVCYKDSDTVATTYNGKGSSPFNSYGLDYASVSYGLCVRWLGNKRISYKTAGGTSSSYGLLANTTYRYYVLYSS